MDYQTIPVTIEDRIITMTSSRLEHDNIFARESYMEIASAIRDLGSRRDAGSIVITGAGGHSSAGGDIRRFKALMGSKEYLSGDNVADVGNMSIAIREYSRPATAMINGVAAGAGLGYTLACDFRVVALSSKTIMAFVNMDFCGDTRSTYNLIRLIGPDRTELLMMTGDAYRGGDRVRMGLATFLAEKGRLQETTYNLASKLAGRSSAAHAGQKRFTKKCFYGGLAGFAIDEGKEIAAASRLSDFVEVVNVFLEKRAPECNR